MFIHQDFHLPNQLRPCKSPLNPIMEPKTLGQAAIVKLLGSSRSQSEWDERVNTILTVHFNSKVPKFWVDLVIKSSLYLRTKQKWVHRRLNSSRKYYP